MTAGCRQGLWVVKFRDGEMKSCQFKDDTPQGGKVLPPPCDHSPTGPPCASRAAGRAAQAERGAAALAGRPASGACARSLADGRPARHPPFPFPRASLRSADCEAPQLRLRGLRPDGGLRAYWRRR